MKKLALCLALIGLVALGGQASAVIGTVDQVPAATLLLPYFEVDLGNTNGVTTLFSVNNASATAALVHVTVWSDLSVPVLDFNIYLTGYDVQTVNMRDILNGILPRTASAGQDPGDVISPKGDFSQDINFASCAAYLPPPSQAALTAAGYVAHLQSSLTGSASVILGGRCAGRDLGDDIARGYVTLDTVNACSDFFPSDPGYFVAGGQGNATNQNILWGDVFIVNPNENFAQGETMVHIEASATDPETSVAGEYTFYGRYVSWTAADNREPLSTNFAARYLNGGAFDGGTSFLVWRDSKVSTAAFTCPAQSGRPSWYPLAQEQIVIFDEEETPEIPETLPISPPPPTTTNIPFPAEAQRTEVGGGSFPVSFDFGWIFLNLNTTVTPAGSNPPEDPTAAQAWVEAVSDASGRFSVGFNAVQLDSATNASHTLIGN